MKTKAQTKPERLGQLYYRGKPVGYPGKFPAIGRLRKDLIMQGYKRELFETHYSNEK